jgi:hypothetical protein
VEQGLPRRAEELLRPERHAGRAVRGVDSDLGQDVVREVVADEDIVEANDDSFAGGAVEGVDEAGPYFRAGEARNGDVTAPDVGAPAAVVGAMGGRSAADEPHVDFRRADAR